MEVIEGAFEDRFAEVLDDVETRGAALAPTFAFIDPFGYSDAPMDLSGRFLQFDRCEVLIYVPLRHVNRFVGRAGQENAMNTLFGTDEWKKAKQLRGDERLRFLHDLFAEQLEKECGLTYVRSFEIVSSANPASGYTLFFGTKHQLGLTRMKESMWDIDRVEGQRYKDTTSSGMQPLFEEEVDTDPLRDAMIAHFGKKRFTIEDALEFTLVDTPYLPSHVKTRTLKPLEVAGKLKVLSERARKGDLSRRNEDALYPVAARGISSKMRPSSSRPPALAVRPPHCLKKNATPPACRHASRNSRTQRTSTGRECAPDSPPAMRPVDPGEIQRLTVRPRHIQAAQQGFR